MKHNGFSTFCTKTQNLFFFFFLPNFFPPARPVHWLAGCPGGLAAGWVTGGICLCPPAQLVHWLVGCLGCWPGLRALVKRLCTPVAPLTPNPSGLSKAFPQFLISLSRPSKELREGLSTRRVAVRFAFVCICGAIKAESYGPLVAPLTPNPSGL